MTASFGLLQFCSGLLVRMMPRKAIHKLFVEYRAWIIVLIVVPASFVYDLFARLRSWTIWWFFQSNVLHEIKVQNIQRQVLDWRKSGCTKKMVSSPADSKTLSLFTTTHSDIERMQLWNTLI